MGSGIPTAACRIVFRRLWRSYRFIDNRRRYRSFATLLLAFMLIVTGSQLHAQQADQAFVTTVATTVWNESADERSTNQSTLNTAFLRSKGSAGAQYANFSIDASTATLFEFFDQDARYISSQDQLDFSHELELRLKADAVIDYEALSSNKQITLIVNAVAKTDAQIRRSFHSSEVEAALAARDLLTSPSSLTLTISVVDFDESPTVADRYEPVSDFGRGFVIRLRDTSGPYRIPLSQMFQDPEERPLFSKANSEDVELREFSGYSPNFGASWDQIGSTVTETNDIAGNSPETDGQILKVRIEDSHLYITPYRTQVEGVRKAEIFIQGWDQRGPTALLPRSDPAASPELAKITVFVQNGDNQLPRWAGHARGFRVFVQEGVSEPLTPTSGTWQATDPDGDAITYSLLGAGYTGACASGGLGVGISFAGTCIRLRSPSAVIFDLSNAMDYELVTSNPVGKFLLLATDAQGGIAEAEFNIHLQDVDEPIAGGFKTSALSIYLPTTNTREIDLSQLFSDPEQRETIQYSAESTDANIVTVNQVPDPTLTITAQGIGRATVRVVATSPSSVKASSVTVVVKNQNAAPLFPTHITQYEFQVLESAAVGTRIGVPITGEDADFGDELAYSLGNNAYFGLSSDGLNENQVQLVTISTLDYETQNRYELVLTVSDGVDSASIPVRIFLADVDEKIRASDLPIPTVEVHADERVVVDISPFFIDDANSTPVYTVTDYNRGIAEVFVEANGQLAIYGNSPGTTDAMVTAVDSAGGVAAKRLTIMVGAAAPELDEATIADRTMDLGLLELQLSELLPTAVDGESIAEASSSDEDVVWALRPKNEPQTLVLYAWALGSATIEIVVNDTNSNSRTYAFMVKVADETEPEMTQLIADQSLRVGERQGSLSLIDAFSADSEEPTTYAVSAADASIVLATLANEDVFAWWHSLDCASKVQAVGDTGVADDSNPYCQDFTDLRVQHKVVARAVAAHHLMLYGLAPGNTVVTATATYANGTSIATEFTATVESRSAASISASMPQRIAYVGERVSIRLPDLVSMEERLDQIFVPVVRDSRLAEVQMNTNGQTLDVLGHEIGTTQVVLIPRRSAGDRKTARFSLKIVNRAPQAIQQHVAVTLEVGEGEFVQNLDEMFEDGQPLSFSLGLLVTDAFDAHLQDSNLVLVPLRRGQADISILATDSYNATSQMSYSVTVSDAELTSVAKAALAGYGRSLLNSFDSVIGARLSESLVVRDTPVAATSFKPAIDNLALDNPNSTMQVPYEDGLADLHGGDFNGHQHIGQNSQLDPLTNSTPSWPNLKHTFSKSESKYMRWSLWLNSDTQVFNGDSYQGRVESLYTGVDLVFDSRIQVGIAGSRAEGIGDYSYGSATRWFESKETLVAPYIRYEPCEGTSFWGIGAVGTGSFTIAEQQVNDDSTLAPTHDLRTAGWMIGSSRQLAVLDSVKVSWTGDFAQLRVSADGTTDTMTSVASQVQRIRSGMSVSSVDLKLLSSVHVRPFVSLNLRHDGGRDRRGAGIELLGGAAVSMGLVDIEFRGRRFETRDEHSYSEHGFALAATLNPSKSLTGLSVSVSPTWGSIDQRFDAFSRHGADEGKIGNWLRDDEDVSRLGIEGALKYGFLTRRDRYVLTPYIEMRQQSVDFQRVGLRLQGLSRLTNQLDVDFSFQQSTMYPDDKDQSLILTGRWAF